MNARPARFRGDAGERVAAVIAGGMRDVADFPEPGILFKDIAPLLADADAFALAIRELALFGADLQIDLVAGVEARGFLIAGALALELNGGLVAIRKAGKLPPPTFRRSYDLEYGSAEIEVPVDVVLGRRVLIVDDVLATGGTMRAAAELIAEAGGTVAAMGVLLELDFLRGRAAVEHLGPLYALLCV